MSRERMLPLFLAFAGIVCLSVDPLVGALLMTRRQAVA